MHNLQTFYTLILLATSSVYRQYLKLFVSYRLESQKVPSLEQLLQSSNVLIVFELNKVTKILRMNYPKRKPLSWSQYYEELLFDLWEENIASIRAGQKSTIVCKAMAEKLDEAGFIGVEMKDVRTKLDNITRKYK